MKVIKMMIVSGMLLGAIACSKEEAATPDSTATSVQTSSTSSEMPLKGNYLIVRYEQDGVENPELREQQFVVEHDNTVYVKGRNYELPGQWTYNSDKDLISIVVPGEQVQAKAVTADTWQVVSNESDMVVLKANVGQSTKKLELKVNRTVARAGR